MTKPPNYRKRLLGAFFLPIVAALLMGLTPGMFSSANIDWGIFAPARLVMKAPMTLYASVGGNDGNACTVGSPCLTAQRIINLAQQTYDINGQNMTLLVGPGVATNGLTVGGPFVGDTCGNVTLKGAPAAAITGATNATPIVITSTAHGLSNGAVVTVQNVGGNTAANHSWTIAGVTTNTFQLVNSVGSGAYTSGGTFTATSTMPIAGTGAAAGITVTGGACFAISGFKISSANLFDIYVSDGSHLFINGPTQIDAPGSGLPQVWSTGLGGSGPGITISAPLSISAGGFNAFQVSHLGQIRWNGPNPIDFVANATYTGPFVYSLGADFTETGGGQVFTNGYTVTALNQYAAIEGGYIQVEGAFPPANNFFPGPANSGYVIGGSTYGAGPAFATVSGQLAQVFGGTNGACLSKHDNSASTFCVDDSGNASFPLHPLPIASGGTGNGAPVAFGSLAACAAGTKGQVATVTDSNTIVWGATIAGSSTNVVLAFCDGTNWTVAGK